MNLFSAAERLAAIDHSAVTFNVERCLHAIDRFSDCQACFELCPMDAIQPGKPPEFRSEKCAHCLACLPACPNGAFSADDELNALLNCVARLEGKTLEILCGQNANLERVTSGSDASVQILSCLAGLGPSAYISTAALGLEQIAIRIDACDSCPWGSLVTQIEYQVQEALRLLAGVGNSATLCLVPERELEKRKIQPILDAHNPPLSRRDLFRLATTSGKTALARTLIREGGGHRMHQPAHERQRIINVLPRLSMEDPPCDVSLGGLKFAILQIDENCTACEACTRICPSGALSCEWNDERTYFKLNFSPQQCNGCQACLHACLPQVIRINPAPTYSEVFGGQESVALQQGTLARCQRCKAPFKANADEKLCPLCEFRRSHPFGDALPPHLRDIIGKR